MKLTLDEAIKLCEDSADKHKAKGLINQANEERQYADWFRELKSLKEGCSHCNTEFTKKDKYKLDKAVRASWFVAKEWERLDFPIYAANSRQYADWLKELQELRADCAKRR